MESAEISLLDLPVGFRFRPTEEELVNHYLKLKILGNKMVELIIPEVDVHQLPPWDLPSKINELSRINSDGDEWFFFCRLQNKHPKRTRRSNDYGSWKKTGGTRKIRTRDKKHILGLKKILVFKERGSPKNAQTKWVLHEYHLNADLMGNVLTDQSVFVLNHLKKNPDKKVKKNSKTQKNNTDTYSIMPKEGIRSRCNMPDEVDNTSISIVLQQGSRSICNTPDEVNNTSCFNALATAKNTVPEEIPKEFLEENVEPPLPPLISPEWNSSECDFAATPQPPTETGEQLNTIPANALVTAQNTVPEEILKEFLEENVEPPLPPLISPEWNSSECDFSATPQPPTETGEQLTHDSSYQDLESYFADYEKLEEILGMLNSD